MYGSFKTVSMVEYDTVHIMQPNQAGYFQDDYAFDLQKYGWNVAFGLTAYDSSSSQIPLDPSYGRLVAFQKSWGHPEDNGKVNFRELKLRPCSRNDINFDGDESDNSSYKFYKPSQEYRADVERFYDKLMYIDEEIRLVGNFNSEKAKLLELSFEVCRDKVDT